MKRNNPYFLLAIASIVLYLGGFTDKESVFDINVHDTYYVVAHSHLCWFLATIVSIIFLIYWYLDNRDMPLIKSLNWIHIYGTLFSIIGLFFPYSLVYNSSRFPLYDDMQYVNICLTIVGLLFLLLQLLFIINIFASIIKKLSNSAT